MLHKGSMRRLLHHRGYGDARDAVGERLWEIVAESAARFLRRIGEETGSGKAR